MVVVKQQNEELMITDGYYSSANMSQKKLDIL